MIETRIGIRIVVGGYIVAVWSESGKFALREEICSTKADAIAAATRLHAESLSALERYIAEQEGMRKQAEANYREAVRTGTLPMENSR